MPAEIAAGSTFVQPTQRSRNGPANRCERLTGPHEEDHHEHDPARYALQATTIKIVEALRSLAPASQLNEWFLKVVTDGTGKDFEYAHNDRWTEVTRPIVEAFFHARYFLEMAVRYGARRRPTASLPSGWAAMLTLYGLR